MNPALALIKAQRDAGQISLRFSGVFDGVRRPVADLFAKRVDDSKWIAALLFKDGGEPLTKCFTDAEADGFFDDEIRLMQESIGDSLTVADISDLATWVPTPAGTVTAKGGES